MYHGYRVSNAGRCQWNDNGVWREKKEKPCRKYRCVILRINGKQKEIAVSKLVYQLFGVKRPNKILREEEAMQRITDKHGNKFTPIGKYTEASQPMLFRCNVCGSEFEETPQHMAIYDEPCKQCMRYKVEHAREARKSKQMAEREARKSKQMAEREARLEWLTSPDCTAYEVYVYIFSDGYAYAGLTQCGRQRGYQHKCDKRSQVCRHSKETGLPIPQREVVETGLNAREATRLEDEWKKKLGENYTILNIAPTGECVGSIGGVKIPHTIEEARQKAKKYGSRKKLRDGCIWAYEMLKEHGELPREKKPKTINELYTIEEARRMKERYNGRKELRRQCGWAYEILKDAGELPNKKKPDVCIEEITLALEKYPTRSLLCKFAPRAYGAARRKGMLPPKEPKRRKETPRRYNIIEHTLENALTILARCKTRSKLWNYPWAYGMLKEHGLLPNKDLVNCWLRGRRPKWGRKAHRTSAELTIKWG